MVDVAGTEFAAIRSVAEKWASGSGDGASGARRSQVDAGPRPGIASQEHAEIKRLKRENAELRRANEILKAASSFFAAELDRPQRYS